MFDTPLRSAALGVFIMAAWVLLLGLWDGLLRVFDQNPNKLIRDARRARFRTYALVLIAVAITMVVASKLVSGG